jgi:outer membrane protein assembly factor BamB
MAPALGLFGLLFALCACGTAAVETPAQNQAPVPEAQATDTPETARPLPTLSPGAETSSTLCTTLLASDDGTVYTFLAQTQEAVYLPDQLPEDIGYVYALLEGDDCLYLAAKDTYFSLDASRLYAYAPADGTVTELADDAAAGCRFCLVGERIFYETYDQGIAALDPSTGTVQSTLPEAQRLLTADGGYLYYTKADGGVYRNDSTGTAEVQILAQYDSYWFYSAQDGLCDISYQENGTLAVLEFRDMDGTLRSQRVLEEISSGLYAQDGILYVPQGQGQTIARFDIAQAQELTSLTLPEAQSDYYIQAVTADTLYYQAYDQGEPWLYALNLDDGTVTALGEILIY